MQREIETLLEGPGKSLSSEVKDRVRLFAGQVQGFQAVFSPEGVAQLELNRNDLIVTLLNEFKTPVPITAVAQLTGCEEERVLDYLEDQSEIEVNFREETGDRLLSLKGEVGELNLGKILETLRPALRSRRWSWRKLTTLARMCEMPAEELKKLLLRNRSGFELTRADDGEIIVKARIEVYDTNFTLQSVPEETVEIRGRVDGYAECFDDEDDEDGEDGEDSDYGNNCTCEECRGF